MVLAGVCLSSTACEASVTTNSVICSYMLDGVSVVTVPAKAYPLEWVDTDQEFRIILTNRETTAVSVMIVPDCKRDEARRMIADRRAQDRDQSTKGIPLVERKYQ